MIRDLSTLEEFRRVVALEKAIWGYTDADDVVGVPILVVTVKRGGILLGAFDARGEMVGFVYSLPGLKQGRPMQWSHMLGVVPGVREAGLGTRLKLAQRERTLAMGLDLVEWTFDPLQAPNAHLNFAKLGVVVREYAVNVYGESTSPLHRGAPTDRFVAEWWVRRPEVEQRLTAGPAATPRRRTAAPVPVNGTSRRDGWCACDWVALDREAPELVVEIPGNFSEMLSRQPDLALDWRLKTRALFTHYFSRGYIAVDFFLARETGGGHYLLARGPGDEGAAWPWGAA
jgi:predicted GNAT superfamily acetyltransferase